MSERIQLTPTQRAAAIERTGESIALLSGAGCGKTLVLARRFTELLLSRRGDENPLSRFAALTFTEKAALEMSQRVRRMLDEFAADSKGPDRRMFLEWVQELGDARISTIHGFCASLLRAHAIEAGIDPDFAVCPDEHLTDRMIADAADEALLRSVEGGREDVPGALTLVGFERLVVHVRSLVKLRTSWEAEAYEDPEQTLRRWRELCRTEREAGWKAFCENTEFRRRVEQAEAIHCGDPGDKLAVYRREQFGIIHALLDDPAARTPDTLAKLQPKPGNIGSGKNWEGAPLPQIRDRIKALVATAAEMSIYTEDIGALDEQAAGLLRTLTHLAAETDALYAGEKRRRGLLDFTDLLALARRLLTENDAVRRALNGQIDQLLVDEAQDTDAFQIALLELVVFGEAGGERLPDGRLFIVGDSKQSIYRFRGAQVEVFEDLCRRLGPRRWENLDRSFRTHPPGVAFVNHLFTRMMGAGYEPISAHRRACPPGPSVEILLAAGDDAHPIADARSASSAQGRLTAQRIAEMVADGERLVWDRDAGEWRAVRYGDVAILFARMTNSLEYERQLALRGVPYYVVGGTGFFRQQEVFDVLNALRCIDNPYDDVAFFGVLRSSLIGLDDNALMRIADALDPPYLPGLMEAANEGRSEGPQAALAGLSEDDRDAIRFAVGMLGDLHRRKDALGIDAIIDRILEATGYEAMLLSQFQGRRMAGNVRMLTEQARSAVAGGASLAEFIAQTGEQVLSESRYEQAAVSGESENVVRLMTIHKAKGLEFPVVFVPDLNAGRRRAGGVLLNRSDWGLTYGLRSDQDDRRDGDCETPLSYRLARRRDDADEQAEDVRKLYVAATRAEDHLVFVGADWRTREGLLREGDSYLRKMDEALGITDALDAGSETIPYDDDRYSAVVRSLAPSPAPRDRESVPRGERLLAEATTGAQLAGAIVASASPASPPALLGPLPTGGGQVELAVTALSEFEHCPMLYRWRYEMRIPGQVETSGAAGGAGASLDPVTMGTLYHRCMELLDFARPQTAGELVRRTVGEMGLQESADVAEIEGELEKMVATLRAHPLGKALEGAKRTFRELDFIMRSGPAMLRGQIDLLYQDADGRWCVVDYKSDRVSADNLPDHARRYELQLLTYASAAARYLDELPTGATLYFLRPGTTHAFPIDADALSAVQDRIAELAAQLVAARRSGQFERRQSRTCDFCPYGKLCAKLRPN